MRKKRLVIMLAMIIFICSCVRTSVIVLSESRKFEPSRKEEVEIFLSEKDVPRPYIKLALIFGEDSGMNWGEVSYEKIVKKMKLKAARLGANGLIIEDFSRQLDVETSSEKNIEVNTRRVVKGIAIYIKK